MTKKARIFFRESGDSPDVSTGWPMGRGRYFVMARRDDDR